MKVSIALPVYNGENYLQEALNSLNNQTYKNIELFLWDHGSTDNTWEIIQNFKCNFSCNKKRCERLPKDGKYNASRIANNMLKEMTGDFYYGFSHDDVMYKDFILNNVVQYLSNPSMAAWQSPLWWFKKFDIEQDTEPFYEEYVSMKELKERMLEKSIINCPTAFISLDILRKLGGWKLEYMDCGDYELFMRIINANYFIYLIRKFLGMYYRVHKEQCTTQLHKLGDGYPLKKLQEEYGKKWVI